MKPKTGRGFTLAAGKLWHDANAINGLLAGRQHVPSLSAGQGESVPLDAAVIVSRRLCSSSAATTMDGLFRVYQRYLLSLLKANAARRLEGLPGYPWSPTAG